MAGFFKRQWQRVATWFQAEAEQVTVEFIEEPSASVIQPYAGYLRVFLSEGFLANAIEWGGNQFPALHGGVSLDFLGGKPVFATFSRPPEEWKVPGAQLDFPVCPLLPYGGGVVEVEAALYKATTDGPLGTAVSLLGSIMGLVGAPLAAAAAIVDKVSDGLDAVLSASGDTPVLGVHWTMVAPGGGGNVLRPGHLVVVNAPAGTAGALSIADGRLYNDVGHGPEPMVGFDYLVLRIEGRDERDDWRFPELDDLIRAAGTAYLQGLNEAFDARRKEAIVRAWNSTDLIPPDRIRVALLVAGEIDKVKVLGAVPGPEATLAEAAPLRLPARDDPQVAEVTLDELLAG